MPVTLPLSCFPIGILVVLVLVPVVALFLKINKLSSRKSNSIEYEITDDNFPLGGRTGGG